MSEELELAVTMTAEEWNYVLDLIPAHNQARKILENKVEEVIDAYEKHLGTLEGE